MCYKSPLIYNNYQLDNSFSYTKVDIFQLDINFNQNLLKVVLFKKPIDILTKIY